ncbi:MAG: hypothetical protein ACPIOQ_19680 [Promethearchaeia archaeon]
MDEIVTSTALEWRETSPVRASHMGSIQSIQLSSDLVMRSAACVCTCNIWQGGVRRADIATSA